MFIDEIEKGTKVKILYKDQVFETTVKSVREERIRFAMLEQIKSEDKVLSFKTGDIELEYDNPAGGIFRFKAEKTGNIYYKGDPYLIFVCNEDTRMYNRRKDYRTEFFYSAEIQLGSNTKVYDGFIHDISRGGINIKIRLIDKPKAVVGTDVSINFFYEKFDRNFRLRGTIVRNYNDAAFMFYGVELENPPAYWLSLVNVTERRSLQIRAEKRQ